MAVSVTLTTVADTVLPSNEDQTVNAIWQTLNPADQLEGGGGVDTLSLTSGGVFDLAALAKFSGFEAVTLTNETSSPATLRLRDDSSAAVTVGRGASLLTTDADGGALITVALGSGKNVVAAGAENDTFTTSSPSAIKEGDVISGGGGFDTLSLGGSGRFGFSSYDFTSAAISGIESIYVIGSYLGKVDIKVNSKILSEIKGVSLAPFSSTPTFVTSEDSLDLGGILFQKNGFGDQTNIKFRSLNATGTTFYVNGNDQAQTVYGGAGDDTIVSKATLTFAQREVIFDTGRSVERIIDPAGTHLALISITSAPAATRQATATITGAVDSTAVGPVKIYEKAQLVASATVQADRTWTAQVSLSGEGAHNFTATVMDNAGNSASRFPSIVLDTLPSTVTISPRNSVNSRALDVFGTAVVQTANGIDRSGAAGSIVNIFDNGAYLGAALVEQSGTWVLSTVLQQDGPHALFATNTDGAGNVGTSATVTIDVSYYRAFFGSVARDAKSAGGQVYALYDGLLGRAPDPLGLEGWVDALDGGTTLSSVAQGFLASPEGQARAGALDNAAFVEQLYQATLHRPSDPTGFDNWVAALNAGVSRADVGLGFALSQEHLGTLSSVYQAGVFVPDKTTADVARLYYGLLDRAPDGPGLQLNTNVAKGPATLQDIAQALIGSNEYEAIATGQTDTQYLTGLYDRILGRAADGGLNAWQNALNAGTSRGDVAERFLDSSEYQEKYAGLSDAAYVDGLYFAVLSRAGDAPGAQDWASKLGSGALTRSEVAHRFVESSEFQTRYVSPSDAAFVDRLYDGALGRKADAGGFAVWTDALAQGASRADVALAISESAEAKAHHVADIEVGWHLI